MAMTLADVRAKYPQYKDVDDKRLADALYAKYYSSADRREFDARIGLQPYQNMAQATGTALGNLPASIAESKTALSQMAAEAVTDVLDPRMRWGNTPPLEVTPGAPIEELVNQPAGIDIPSPQKGLEQLIPPDIKRALQENAADQSVRAQLNQMAARKAQTPLDVAPGSAEEIVAGGITSVAEMALPAAASVAIRNAAPLVAYFTARSGGTGYGQARQAGAAPDTARVASALYAASEAVTEAVAAKVFVEGGKTLVRSVLKGAGVEGLTEGVTEALQALVDSGVVGEDMTIDDVLQRVKVAAATGAIAGAPIAAMTHGIRAAGGKEATPGVTVMPDAPIETPAVDAPIEDRVALPAPQTLLALPSPEAFKEPVINRRQPPAPEQPAGPEEVAQDERDYQARIALQRTRQTETAALLQTARETITPIGTFTPDEIGPEAAGRVRQRRIRLGRPVEAPVTIDELAAAKVPQRQIDAVIERRRPNTSQVALTPLDIKRAAEAKNIISSDSNFSELAYRTTGQRNPERMTQTQLHAFKSTLESLPAHDKPVTVPVSEAPAFTDEMYGKAVDAVRKQGRYTAGAIKQATGLKSNSDVAAIRDAMVRRGQLVQRGKNDFRLYDVLGEERQTTPDQLPPGAFKEHVVRRIPVAKVRIRQDGKSIGTFGSGTEARTRVKEIRAAESQAGARTPSAVVIEPAEEVAYGVMENRYDEQGNLLGQVVVDSYRDEAAANKAANELNTPDVGARYTQTTIAPSDGVEAEVDRQLPYLKQDDILAADAQYQEDMREWQRLTDEINAGMITGDRTKQPLSSDAARERISQRDPVAERIKQKQEQAKNLASKRRLDRAELRERLESRTSSLSEPVRRITPAALEGRLPEVLKRLNQQAKDRKLPLLGVRVQVKSKLNAPEGDRVEGLYWRKLIQLTAENLTADMTTDQIVERLAQVIDHETIHALREAGVLGPETQGWKAIVRYARRARLPGTSETYYDWAKRTYTGIPGYADPSAIEEEAIAEAFRAWAANRRNVVGQPATVFRQIVEWFRRLFTSLPEDAFMAIETGRMVEEALTPPGASQPRARATQAMEQAAAGVAEAQAARNENLVRVRSREYLRARAQAREDRYGRSGPKTVLGTTPSRAYETGEVADRALVEPIVERFKADNGVTAARLQTYLPEDIDYLKRVADAQQRAMHDPGDAAVQKSYRALIDETKAMWRALGDVEIEMWTGDGQPYKSPAEMMADVAQGRLKLRLSSEMFGPGADNPGHPLNVASGVKTTTGEDVTYNDLLRVVHDIYGHGQSGFRDTPRGAYNAYHEHARLVSPEARGALATETLAQRAWQEFGSHLRRRDGTVPRETDVDYLKPNMKEFAEQKAFLLPEDVVAADPGWALADKAASIEDLPKFSLPDNRIERDARPSEIGKGYGDYITYTDKNTGAYLQVVERIGAARDVSVISFEVPEEQRGKGVGRALFGYVLKQHPSLMGQVSSKAAAKIAYDAGRRPWGQPDATLDDVMRKIEEDSSVNLLTDVSRFDDNLPGGRLYGNPERSPGGMLSKPGTPTPAFTADRPGNRFFGGELAEEQLRMVRDGDRGATMIYMTPEDYLRLSGAAENPEQEVFDAALAEGYKASTIPSLVTSGYAGNVRAVDSDGAAIVRALAGRTDAIPVVLYPKGGESLGLVTALEGANGERVPWPHSGRAENFVDMRGPRYSVGSEEFRRWFGDSKVVNPDGSPKVVYHGTRQDFNAFEPNIRKTEQLGFGIHFAEDEGFAARYADDDTVARKGKSPRVIPAFLSIQNPLKANRLVREGEPDFELARQIAGSKLFTTKDENGVPSVWLQNAIDAGSPARAQKAIQDAGYDGVEYEARLGSFVPGGRGVNISGRSRSYIVFEPTQIKSAVNNNGQYDATNPDIRYSLNAPYGQRVPNTPPGPMYNIVQQRTDGMIGRFLKSIGRSKKSFLGLPSVYDVRVKLQDKMLSWKEINEYAAEHGGSITDINDVYMLEQLYHGKVFDQIAQREADLQVPLLEALRLAHNGPHKIQPTEFEDYLYARHAPERNAYLRTRGAPDPNPSGMSDAEASSILDRFALDGKLPELEALAVLADRITADTTRTRVEAGLISQQAVDGSPYQYYVPLRGFADEALDPADPTENQTWARSGKGFSVGGREDRTVTGRGRKAGDLLGHMFLQNTEAVIRAQKNEVALAAMRFIQDNASLGIGQVLKSAPTRRVVGANGMIHEAGDPSFRQQPDIITAKWKGNEIIARLADPRLARAIKSDYVTSANDMVNGLVALAGRLNRYLATINTSWNPEFLISNLARDMQTAGILSQQYDIPQFGRKIVGNAPKAMGGIREVLRTGEANSEWAKTFRELQQAGGTTEFLGIHDLEQQVDRIRRSITQTGLATTPRKVAEYLGKVGKFVDDYNKVAENAFRLSAFKAAREAGVSVPQAAYLAKNLTVNFNKGGELKTFMNAMYLFYNASTQGAVVLMNGLKNRRVQKLVGGVVVTGLAMDVLNRLLSGDEDDNGVTDYDDIPEYVLETNFVMMDPLGVLENIGIKQGYFAIPMPYGFNAFYNLGRNISAGFSGSPVRTPGKSAVDSLLGFMDAFNPLGGVQSIWNFIAPTFADPAVDLITNKDFAGNAIVPERPSFGLPVPDSQKSWSNTSEIPKGVAEWLNNVTGGNEVRKGAVDLSPETLQYGFDYATGAMGKFAQRLFMLGTDTAPKALQGDFADIEVGNIPFIRRVVGSIGKRGNTERYYSVAQEVETVKEELKLFAETGQADRARAHAAAHPVEVKLIGMFDDADKALQGMRKQLRDIREATSIPAAKKREMELKIKAAMDSLMANANRVYFEQKKLVSGGQ